MNEIFFEKSDDYLNDKMSSEERKSFELEIASDKELAMAFGIYKTTEREMHNQEMYRDKEIALKNSLAAFNKTYFKAEDAEPAKMISGRSFKMYKLVASIAAVFILFIAGYFLFTSNNSSTQQLAVNYTQQNLSVLSTTMDASKDMMKQGIAAYNNKDYSKAMEAFQQVHKQNPSNSYAVKYIGIVYLVTKDFNNASQTFDELNNMKGFSNPGMFLKAVTLMQRNNQGDKEQAKLLLQQVVNEKAEGSEEAENWLKRF